MNRILSISVLLASLTFLACEEDVKPCKEERETAAVIGTFPDSLQIGESYELKLNYILDNSCGEFDRFDVSVDENVFEIKMIASYEGCNCDIGFSEHQETYEIDVDYPGVYEYRFWVADEDWDIRTLKIYE